jgi:hypothetical protein
MSWVPIDFRFKVYAKHAWVRYELPVAFSNCQKINLEPC